jgi:Bacterial regulatory proteins, luxR family
MASEAAELSAVIGEIYDAAIDPTLWRQTLGAICAFVGGSSAVLFWHDSAAVRSQALHFFNEDPVYTRLYFEKYLPLNPMFPAASFVDEGVVTSDDDIMPRAEITKTRFYKEWLKPQGIKGALSVNLEKGIARTSMINVRLTVSLTDRMRRRLGLLVPHLLRAVTIGKLFDQKKSSEEALSETLDHVEAAVYLVGAHAEIVFANKAAEEHLVAEAFVKKIGNELCATAPDTDRTLRSILASAAKGDRSLGVRGIAVPLKNSSSQERWFAHVLPLTSSRRQQIGNSYSAIAAVFIRKNVPNELSPLEGIAKLYKLRSSEVRVLDAVLKVSGVKAIAELLGLSQATVKTHLRQLFRKTKTGRQTDLVKLVAGLRSASTTDEAQL